MDRHIPYRKIFRAAVCIAVASILALGGISNNAHAQDCSRNMLHVFGPQSYVATPDAQALHLTKGFTIEYWARLDRLVNLSGVVDKGSYGIFLNADSSMFGVVRKTNSFDITAPANDSLQNWHHFAFVFTPGDSMRLYLDSSEVASVKSSILSIDSNTDSLRIAMSYAGASWLGSIDELRIWNTPRSIAEIKRTLFHTLAGNDSGLVLYYSFDDETGSRRIHDFSGHGHDGFIHGTSAEIVPSSSPILNGSPGF
ncbi:MAG TPA: LamG domain-containing protein, partial [Candidatus Kapabacteria bacterium]|nr:LamG domain-containing protein [Candidatus Kapabacteria bacterium]